MKRMSLAVGMLVAMLAAFALTSCTSSDSEKPDAAETSEAASTAHESAQKPENSQQASTELIGPVWFIVDIDGQNVLENSPASVEFLAARKMNGNTSCNNFLGFFGGGGEDGRLELDIGATKTSPCSEPLKKQEKSFLGMLYEIRSYTINGNTLYMKTDDGKTMTARRR